MSQRAAIYVRISQDRSGEGLGVARQLQDCQELAAREGHTVVATLVENDLSAYSGKRRPQYEILLASMRAGGVDVVMAWDPDRLHRSPRELEEFISVVEAKGISIQTCQAGVWDLSTPSGRLVARQLGAIARYESEHKSARLKRKWVANAAAGARHGHRAFGWTLEAQGDGAVVEVVHPLEAAVVSSIAECLLEGKSLRAICDSLNATKMKAPRGGVWNPTTVKNLVLRERNLGLRVHHGKVVGQGQWPPIMNSDTHAQVAAILKDPARRTSTATTARYLLSGIAACGVCGEGMQVCMNNGHRSYRCAAKGHVSRNQVAVDAYVVAHLLALLARDDVADLLSPATTDAIRAARVSMATLRARLMEASDSYSDGLIDRGQLERITATIRPALKIAETAAAQVAPAPLLADLARGGDVAGVWEGKQLAQRRAIVATLLTVVIQPVGKGRSGLHPESVSISLRA